MGWMLLPLLVLALGTATLSVTLRRLELRRMARRLEDLDEARRTGSHQARLQYPDVDLSRCIGCGTCVAACPEEGVLDLIHGQAVVVHGARCVGHGLCARACPVGAIRLTLGDLASRQDIPALTDQWESCQVPGLFLAGEVTGYALIRTAITHGTAVAEEVARRISRRTTAAASADSDESVWDLLVVGAGPAGIAASLQAKARQLRTLTIDQATLGGTVSQYPRRKLVMTQPVTLPLHGPLKRTSYSKEELMELWAELAEQHQLNIRHGEQLLGIDRDQDELFRVRTTSGVHRSRYVCLCLGRRGTPRKLEVPGEDLSKVAYSLIDAQSYRHRRILVVGGGDSAVEAAMGLAEQAGNHVSLSYRKESFFRLKARNEVRLMEMREAGTLDVLLCSRVMEIREDTVCLRVEPPHGPPEELLLPNDDVFVMVGGIPPFDLLQACGVSFAPEDRPVQPPLAEQGTGLLAALCAALLCAVLSLLWAFACRAYYGLTSGQRPLSLLHDWLRPSGPVGLACGFAGALLILANLAYLLRRNWPGDRIPGTLAGWMTSHVVTGILALLLILVHAALAPGNTVGGHASWALGVLVVTGAIGRYFYSCVPRAANGKELALAELQAEVAAESSEWDRLGRGFGDQARQQIHRLVAAGKWQGTFPQRLVALLRTQRHVGRVYRELREEGLREGLSGDQLERVQTLARKAYRAALIAAHYEDLRALLNTWRFFHRWIALLMVLLAAIHIAVACRYGSWWPW